MQGREPFSLQASKKEEGKKATGRGAGLRPLGSCSPFCFWVLSNGTAVVLVAEGSSGQRGLRFGADRPTTEAGGLIQAHPRL